MNNNIQQGSSFFRGPASSDPVAFLDMEKKRIREGIEILKDEIRVSWRKRHAGESVFPNSVAQANPNAVSFLLSASLVGVYDEIARANGFDSRQRDAIPHIIWKFFVEGLTDGIGEMLVTALQISPSQRDVFLKMINEKVLNKLVELNSKSFSKSETSNAVGGFSEKQEKKIVLSLSLQKALVEYSKLGDQAVTSSPIKLRVFPEPVRPSIKNWVNDYHDHLGSGKHTTIERGNFLFHSDNGKRLSTFERRKLAEVLKSLDEDSVVSVDVENERMIFESSVQTQEINPRPEQTATAQSNVQSQNFSRPVISNPVSRPIAPRPNIQSVQNVSRGINEISGGKSNVSLGEKRGFQVVSEEDYIQNLRKNINSASLSPASNQNVENGKTWNPAEAVKRRMEEESKNQSFSQSESAEELSRENVVGGKVSFSSPQVLPVEKRDSDLGVRSGSDFPQTVQTANEADAKKSDSDNLMARIREMNKKSSPSSRPNIGFKITPSGNSNGNTSLNGNDEGVSTRGNIVDLR